jgi:hypothetical protein
MKVKTGWWGMEMTYAEKLFLLLIVPRRESLRLDEDERSYLYIGAILAELVNTDALSLNEGKLRYRRNPGLDDELMNRVLRTFRDAGERGVQEWIYSLKNSFEDLEKHLIGELCKKGIVERRQRKVLGMPVRTVYPICKPELLKEIVTDIRKALIGGYPCSRETRTILRLLYAGRLINVVLPKQERPMAEKRAGRWQGGEIETAVAKILYERRMIVHTILATSTMTSQHF